MKKISISGVIGWDATASALREELQAAGGAPVELVISSPGGFVSDGLEMFNLIRNYPGETTAVLSGYAMSMASYIPLAANRIVAEDNAVYMIHNVRGGVFGDHNDILNYGATTKGLSKLIAKAYQKRTGKDMAEIEKMMDAETYLFGSDMVDHGFVDSILDTGADKDAETARAMACVAMNDCNRRMASDISAVKQDLASASALMNAMSTNFQPPQNTKEINIMTIEKLKAEHPEVYQAMCDEARQTAAADHALALEEAKQQAVTGERQRIADCRAQAIPGHEALVDAMAFDGKSTSADVALAIIGAEKKLRSTALQNLQDDAPPAAPPAYAGDTPTPADDPATEEAAKAQYDKDAALQKEFGSFKSYYAYVKASSAGRARIFKQ
jgi:ATP-dependent Clp protease, protease subunit